MTKHDATFLEEHSARLETATPREILRWAMQTYGDKLTMSTAFGAAGCSLLDMIARIRDEDGLPQPDVFNLETGYQFQQTLDLRDKLQQRYDLKIRLASAAESVAEMEKRFGGPIYDKRPDECCHIRKVMPLQEAVQGFEAWISSIRRDQTPERADTPIVGYEERFDLVKISPLANWTRDRMWDYIRENEVPTNPLHELGFASIGCWPCTRAVAEGEDERAGRWAGSAKRECGLHYETTAAVK